ncbi:hypothetical protein CPB84DRAFT_1822675 [Gymnopilus junonius]|uniref:Uncharacterized protein n=1 Tax=Gymnopilus junonius TaxID=109634 RepID=A0A9P5NXF8_GYMJU|nr:hypothetical protein CPB84DRAFT_1822675 [Gymnopilus junonius]
MPVPLVEQIPSPTAGGRALSQSRADRLSRLSQASPTDHHARRQPTWARRGSRLSTPEPDNQSWPFSPAGHIHDVSPGSSSYMSSDMSSPVTPATTIEDVYSQPHSFHGTSHETASHHPGGTPEGGWPPPPGPPPYVGSYNPGIQTYFPPVGHQYYHEMAQNHGNYDMQPHLVPAQQQVLPHSYNSPSPMSNGQPLPQQSMEAPAAPDCPLSYPHQTLLPCAQVPPSSAVLQLQQHGLPPSSYNSQAPVPNVQHPQQSVLSSPSQSMSSGLVTEDIERTLPATLPASQAGGLYATRDKHNIQPLSGASQRPAGLIPTSQAPAFTMMNGTTAAMPATYHAPAYTINYSSSLTGWAGS